MGVVSKLSIAERFWIRVNKGGPDDCWLWTGGINFGGYGRFSIKRSPGRSRTLSTHRFAWELLRGPIPDGLTIDHLCGVRLCVNPAHMEPVTMTENILRSQGVTAINARRTECKNGHPFDDINTYFRPSGGRACRACSRESWRRTCKRRGDCPAADPWPVTP